MRYPHLTGALVVGGAAHTFSDTYFGAISAFGLEGPEKVNEQRLATQNSDLVARWKTDHSRADDPDYWRELLRQISNMWWTPLGYVPEDFQKIVVPTLILDG